MYKRQNNVQGDVEKMIEWQAVVKDEQGRLIAPYSEIVVDVCLPQHTQGVALGSH